MEARLPTTAGRRSLSAAAAGSWATGSANQVLNGYAYVNNYSSMTLAVNSIPYARYSLYAYVGDSSTGNQEMATINGTSYYYSTEGGTPITYTAISSRSSSNYQSGNYIEVDGLTGSSQTVTVAGTTQQYGGLCSVEIVNAAPGVGAINILPATTALSIARGGTLDLCGDRQQVASLSDQVPGSGGSIINSNSVASTLTLSPSGGSSTFSGMIRGGGTLGTISLVVSGSGVQVLAGSNTYTGPTTINQGTLLVNGSLVSPVTVNSGGTLGGTGNLASGTVSSGGAIAPGSALGSLHFSGALVLAPGGDLDYELDLPGTSSMITCNSLTLGGQNFSNFAFPYTANFCARHVLFDRSQLAPRRQFGDEHQRRDRRLPGDAGGRSQQPGAQRRAGAGGAGVAGGWCNRPAGLGLAKEATIMMRNELESDLLPPIALECLL